MQSDRDQVSQYDIPAFVRRSVRATSPDGPAFRCWMSNFFGTLHFVYFHIIL